MGLLSFLSKPAPTLARLPSGSLTVDSEGCLLASTVSSSFPGEVIDDIAHEVLVAFREASEAQLPLSELCINYPSLKITARELRGGAILFLVPQTPYAQTVTQ
jgi:hypothetical protein